MLKEHVTHLDSRRAAKFLYWQGWSLTDIALKLDERRSTVGSWKRRDQWDVAPVIERIEGAAESRLIRLVMKEQKSGADYKEIDLLGRQMERYARVRKYLSGGNEIDLNPTLADRYTAERKKTGKN